MNNIKPYYGKYDGPEIDRRLGLIPTFESRITNLEKGMDKTETFTFSQAASVHTIEHSMNKYPSVTIVDLETNEEIMGDVEYASTSKIIVRFNINKKCIVYLN